jgi:preprotein translocase subunit YajC
VAVTDLLIDPREDLVELLPLAGLVLLFWLLLWRPQARRQRELRGMQDSLTVGDEVVLTSGIYGTVREVVDNDLRVEVADGVVIRVARGAIGAIKRPDTDSEVPDEGEEGNE